MRTTAGIALLALAAAGCGTGEPRTPEDDAVGATRYTGVVYVEEREESLGIGPPSCVVPEIGHDEDPPGSPCGIRIPLAAWDWEVVDGEERAEGVVWGRYRVVGTYDGETFTVESAEPATDAPDPLAASEAAQDDLIAAECPEPPGGWRVLDRVRTGDRDWARADRYARRQPEYSGTWLVRDRLPNPLEPDADPAPPVIVYAFSGGDVERHAAELRAVWGGPICVVERAKGERNLDRTMDDVVDYFEASGLAWDMVDGDPVLDVVTAQVFIVTPDLRAGLDARYGVGLVHVVGHLEPVE